MCLLYFINTYYKFNEEWGDSSIKNGYDYERYYSDKAYKKELIASAAELFLSKTTIKILVEISKELHDKSIGNLLRSSALEESYQIKLSGIFSEELSLSEEYIQFIKKFKCKEN